MTDVPTSDASEFSAQVAQLARREYLELEISHLADEVSGIAKAYASGLDRVDANAKDRLVAVQREIEIAFAASEKALDKALTAQGLAAAVTADRVRTLEVAASSVQGETKAGRRASDRIQPWQLWVAGAVLTVITLGASMFLTIVLAVVAYLTTH